MNIESMLNSHPRPAASAPVLARCIEACFDCAAICSSCADACLAEPQVDRLRRCISLNLSCADICLATGRIATRFSADDPEAYLELVSSCAAICGACAMECEAHAAHHDHCRICAEACRSCERACREVLATGAGTSAEAEEA
jgi:hypothetical protein